jgi:riboflavin kinase / FMN adenylyltransferase
VPAQSAEWLKYVLKLRPVECLTNVSVLRTLWAGARPAPTIIAAMKIFHGTDNAGILRGTVLTLGVFDGLHLGHQRIMQTVVERAQSVNAVPTVITFDPHPRAVLHPENAPPLLQTLDQRLANFEILGIEQTIVIRFDKEFATLEAETFLRDIVHERLQAREVYLGKGFFFGKNRGGNIELLREMSKKLGFFADEVPEVQLRGQRISSSEIRRLLADGKVNLVRRMLGRPYGVEGQIIHGFRRGHTIGFPTANLHPHNRVIPKYGVYATATLIEGVWRRSITNVGVRPTFEDQQEPSIESYIFDFAGDLYGDVLRVRFLHRIRDERKFSGVDELRGQIERDTCRALNYFKRLGVKNSLNIV